MSHVNPSSTIPEQWRPLWWIVRGGWIFLLLPLFWIDRRRAWSMCVWVCAFLSSRCHSSSTRRPSTVAPAHSLLCVGSIAAVPPVGVKASVGLWHPLKKDWPSAVPSAVYLPVGHLLSGFGLTKTKTWVTRNYLEVVFLYIVKKFSVSK